MELELDLESGGTTSSDESTKIFITSKLDDLEHDNLEPLIIGMNSEEGEDNSSRHMERRDDNNNNNKSCVEQKRKKKTNSRKPPKPPRPPNGPSLSAVDQKLARELAELAMRKRARIERMKALKKMKASKVSLASSSLSSSSTLYAMIVTVLFCLVIITQGCLSRSRLSVGLDGSPAPAVVASNEALISVQFYKSFSPNERDEQGPNSFNLVSRYGRNEAGRKLHGQMR